jgi:hypothetical protein
MNPDTLTALQLAIKKWERIVDGTEADLGAQNCALCRRFNERTVTHDCKTEWELCPVYKESGEDNCANTPYTAWNNAQNKEGRILWSWTSQNRKADTPHLVALAQAELDFLRSLLPPSEGNFMYLVINKSGRLTRFDYLRTETITELVAQDYQVLRLEIHFGPSRTGKICVQEIAEDGTILREIV